MKAMVFATYGSPDVLQLTEMPKPTPKDDDVLVKIHATAVNDYDWSLVRGKPFLYRIVFGFFKPRKPIPGMELAGTIEAIGANVTSFKVGDAVYGDTSEYGFGTFAEYICVNEKALVLKPEKMTFEEATTIPHASMLAFQGLMDKGKIQQGERVLINGGGGGVGTFGLQLAKLHGAHVTGVDTGEKLQMMKELGFDHVIDYKKEDFIKNGQRYDLVLDAKTTRSSFAYPRALKPGGRYVTVGGNLTRLLQLLFLKRWISKFSGKQLHIVGLAANKDLDYINELFDAGKIKCIIDGPYKLEESAKAIQRFGDGKHSGKVVVSIDY
ncbi:MAG: NAD(P)-dependent alcohol dehydrogenase [Calditrichia bacterium]